MAINFNTTSSTGSSGDLSKKLANAEARLEKQELFLAEIITWLKEYFPNMGYTPELREQEWKTLISNIQLINKGHAPKRREEIEEEADKQAEAKS
jgi:hypothetical protein